MYTLITIKKIHLKLYWICYQSGHYISIFKQKYRIVVQNKSHAPPHQFQSDKNPTFELISHKLLQGVHIKLKFYRKFTDIFQTKKYFTDTIKSDFLR